MKDLKFPENYTLGKIATEVASYMNLELKEAEGNDRKLVQIVTSLTNPTDHFILFSVKNHKVKKEIVLLDEYKRKFIYYYGAISTSINKPIEAIYVTDSKKVIAVTLGYPENIGVLEVLDVGGNIALQEFIGGQIPRGLVYAGTRNSQLYEGIVHFRESNINGLSKTIEKLLG